MAIELEELGRTYLASENGKASFIFYSPHNKNPLDQARLLKDQMSQEIKEATLNTPRN